MNRLSIISKLRIILSVGLLWVASTSLAVTVHTWVDADGVRHFADAPPGDGSSAESDEITVDGGGAPRSEDIDYYSITNQWQRLRAERDAQDAMELERRRLDDAQAPSPPPLQDDVPRSVFYPNYFYGQPPRGGPMFPPPPGSYGPPSPRNAFVNTPPPVWPRER